MCLLSEGRELEEFGIDHIIPLSLGGTEDSSNLHGLCPGCHRNRAKGEVLEMMVTLVDLTILVLVEMICF